MTEKEKTTQKFEIKSYTLIIDEKKIGYKMYPIDIIIKALKNYYIKYNGIVGALSGKKTVEDIVEENY